MAESWKMAGFWILVQAVLHVFTCFFVGTFAAFDSFFFAFCRIYISSHHRVTGCYARMLKMEFDRRGANPGWFSLRFCFESKC